MSSPRARVLLIVSAACIGCARTLPEAHAYLSTTAGHLTSRSLPHSSRFVLALLSAAEIQRFADDHGDVSYLEVYPVQFNGDTASVEINSTVAIGSPSHQGPVVQDGATSCDWIVARHSDRWVVVGSRNCLTLD